MHVIRWRRAYRVLAATLGLGAAGGARLGAQQPVPPQPPPAIPPGAPQPQQQPVSAPSILAPYRAPAIAMVQPAAGALLPADRPVAVFRFSAGEPGDPIDAASFRVAVDGEDRTALFQVSATEAWGALVSTDSQSDAEPTARRALQVSARICSVRGACATVAASVTLAPPIDAAPTPPAAPERGLLETLLGLVRTLLGLARKLLIL